MRRFEPVIFCYWYVNTKYSKVEGLKYKKVEEIPSEIEKMGNWRIYIWGGIWLKLSWKFAETGKIEKAGSGSEGEKCSKLEWTRCVCQ